jgi:bifunctional non-homologous end joining protein LigD
MSLEKYQAMRQFDATPEPEGGQPGAGEGLRFVVQKHAASHLHYDFRLEMGGVLVSWAVPKGPSVNPEDKRLAMKVEDHPFDYRMFEGVIPEGHYGAGTVMVWDEGMYTPYAPTGSRDADEKSLRAGLHKGHITFILHGRKLKGEWALIKIHGSDENAWLLVKAGKDEWASEDIDITSQDLSVQSGRSLEGIAEGEPAQPELPELNDAPAAPLPAETPPMLATLGEKPFDNPDWFFEVKWDGYRAIATIGDNEITLQSRNGQDFRGKYPAIYEALKNLGSGPAILDGEIVVVDESGKSRFELLQNYEQSGGNLRYYVFDILYLNGRDLTKLPLAKRKSLLETWLPASPIIKLSEHVAGQGKAFFQAAANQNLEGIMAKDSRSRYLPGKRSASWLKLKHLLRQEAVIGGFTAPRGSRTGFGSLVLGIYQNGKLMYAGHSGGGFDEASLAGLHARLLELKSDASPFAETFKTNAPVTWVRPELVCEIQFTEWTSDGRMRHPVFVGLREDKPAAEVTHEQAAPPPAKDLKISNPKKIYWPDSGFTKGELINYYERLAPTILPYLVDRPQSLLRFPDGIAGKSFFHKDVTEHPDFIRTAAIRSDSEDRDIHYLVVRTSQDLLYLINLGCIDLNPWNSRVGHLDNPDWCVIDLDPEDIGFDAVIETARAVHRVLKSASIPSYPKTSGATGIHIFIPLGARYTYEQSKNFAQIIGQLVNASLPDITSLERSPAKRQGKVYLDYLQNRRGQTLAAPYSVRPRPGLPVSAPLHWDEVAPGLRPLSFTVNNIEARLAEQGDLWKPVTGPGIDLLAALEKLA